MTLYIEYVILDNLIVDYLLLNLLDLTFKQRSKRLNKFFSALFGTVFAIFLPYLYEFKIVLFVYKMITGVIMILLLKKYNSIKNYLSYYGMFLIYTFLFGGVILWILNNFGIEYSVSGVLMYNGEIPISVFIIILYVVYKIIKFTIKKLNNLFKKNSFMHEIKIMDNGVEVSGVGYYDSGNMLTRDNYGVNIISMNMFLKLHKDCSFENLLLKKIDHNILKEPRYINIESLANGTKYLSFVVDKFFVDEAEIENPIVAVAIKNFKNFDCIINSKCIGG